MYQLGLESILLLFHAPAAQDWPANPDTQRQDPESPNTFPEHSSHQQNTTRVRQRINSSSCLDFVHTHTRHVLVPGLGCRVLQRAASANPLAQASSQHPVMQ